MIFGKKHLVSIVMPAFNHEKYVGMAVESVLNQSYKNIELIVIDDGSTDRTGEVVQSYKDPRLKYVYQENQDAYNALNQGLRMANGDFISILNSDDMYSKNRLKRLLKIGRKTKAACIFTDVQPISETGDQINDPDHWWNIWHQKNRSYYFQCGDLYIAFLKGNFMVTTSNLFIRKDAVKKIGNFCSLRYLHDYDYIFRVMLAFPHKVVYLQDEKELYYRLHGDNTLSEAAIIGREQDMSVIRKYMLERIPIGLQPLVIAGIDRLIELEQELFREHQRILDK